MTGPHIAPADPLLNPGEVAALFRVDPKTVTRWANEGKLPVAFRTLGGQRRFRESVVHAFLGHEASQSEVDATAEVEALLRDAEAGH